MFSYLPPSASEARELTLIFKMRMATRYSTMPHYMARGTCSLYMYAHCIVQFSWRGTCSLYMYAHCIAQSSWRGTCSLYMYAHCIVQSSWIVVDVVAVLSQGIGYTTATAMGYVPCLAAYPGHTPFSFHSLLREGHDISFQQ